MAILQSDVNLQYCNLTYNFHVRNCNIANLTPIVKMQFPEPSTLRISAVTIASKHPNTEPKHQYGIGRTSKVERRMRQASHNRQRIC